MIEVAQIRTRKNRSSIPSELKDVQVRVGDYIVVEVDNELECAQVASKPYSMEKDDLPETYSVAVRSASDEDMEQLEKNESWEREAFRVCQDRISAHSLDMKLVTVESLFDRSKLKFYYTSEGRVDFRDLVKDLAQKFHTRIEMRQIGVRDQAALVGGFGVCGLTLCCATFLRGFAPITIKMAKEQNLALNPSKISGQCGRLLCCLRYEYEHYRENRRRFPKINARVRIPENEAEGFRGGEGNVTAINMLRENVTVRMESETVTVRVDEITVIPKTGQQQQQQPRKQIPPIEDPKADDKPTSESASSTDRPTSEGRPPRRRRRRRKPRGGGGN